MLSKMPTAAPNSEDGLQYVQYAASLTFCKKGREAEHKLDAACMTLK